MRLGGIGTIWSIPALTTSSTPIPLAVAKSATIDFKQERKPLRGQWMDPIDMLAGARDISVKFAGADFRAATVQLVLQGSTLAANATKNVVVGENWVSATTVTVAQSATWSEDAGVLDLTAGKWLTRVASAPATGQYSVAAGVYTFAVADAGHNLTITYTYTSTTAGSQTLAVTNQVVQQSTGYLVRVFTPFLVGGVVKTIGVEFPWVHFSDLSLALKPDDWAEQSLTGMVAQSQSSTATATLYVGE